MWSLKRGRGKKRIEQKGATEKEAKRKNAVRNRRRDIEKQRPDKRL
jgi:hypothetical protein